MKHEHNLRRAARREVAKKEGRLLPQQRAWTAVNRRAQASKDACRGRFDEDH